MKDVFELTGLGSLESRTVVVHPPHGVIVLEDISPRLVPEGCTADIAVVNNARVSYRNVAKTLGAIEEKRSKAADRRLIDYLVSNRHTSPLERVSFTFNITMPIFVARQWIRHRTARLNESSARYSTMDDAFFVPPAASITAQSKTNKQQRETEGQIPYAEEFVADLTLTQREAYERYEKAIAEGVPRELARCILPVSIYTCIQWTMDLHNLLHFMKLRSDVHAQAEIKVYSDAMLGFVEKLCPMVFESWMNHVRDAITISASDLADLRYLLKDRLEELYEDLGGERYDATYLPVNFSDVITSCLSRVEKLKPDDKRAQDRLRGVLNVLKGE